MFYFLRTGVIIVFVLSGHYVGQGMGLPLQGIIAGAILGFAAITIELALGRATLSSLVGGVVGLAMGLFTARMIMVPLNSLLPDTGVFPFVAGAFLGYGGLVLGLKKGSSMTIASIINSARGNQGEEANKKLLDTSVIIDGRIADVSETGFLEGVFIVPQFILLELQHIADSPDSLKRARGRRGLDILNRMQKMSQITVQIVEHDFPKIREVDSKLVALAKVMNAKVITNDFNLNKVAELQGVPVLNVNELANAIKPVVLPGETMRVFVIKEGKEQNQGVAYLDDGTMVVVDNGRKLISKNVDVTVTSVLQTTAGRMIFSKSREDYERDDQKASG